MQNITADPDLIRGVLRELGFVPHHTGYKLLIDAIILYAHDNTQSATKELYPILAKQSHLYSAASIERSMRYAISEDWSHGSQQAWQQYFPQQSKAPSNSLFIATVAEYWL